MPYANPAPCRLDGCDRASEGRHGLCGAHRKREKRYGSVGFDAIADRSLRMLQTKVDASSTGLESDCWPWVGKIIYSGYGSFGDRGAHRAAYEALVGAVPDGMELDHACHTNDASCPGGDACMHRRCVNPAHLEPVTKSENKSRAYAQARAHAEWVLARGNSA